MRTAAIAILIFTVNAVLAQTSTYPELLKYYQLQKNFNGAVVVATKGRIDYINGMGFSSRQSGTIINSKSRFKIASITKTFTAVLVLQLMEEGKLDLQSTIGKYLPGYAGPARDKVTLEDLLTYSSGIPNCESYTGNNIYAAPISVDSFITKYCSGRLEHEPGTFYNYDNGDYILLGRMIEKMSGKSFAQMLEEKILAPLGMQNTGMLHSEDIITGLVSSYVYSDSTKSFSADKPYYIENFFSAGALYSTVEDLLKFDEGIFNYQLLQKKTVDLMLVPHPKLDNVGLGFWISNGYGALNTRFAYRPGGIYGSSANWIHVLDSNRAIIVFSNTDATNLFAMSQQLNAVATKQKLDIPASEPVVPSKTFNSSLLKGVWTIDLRPAPNSEAYFKDFIINPTTGKDFSGEFYGSPFSSGKFNTDWDLVYFAFTTSDRENVYFHSGYIDGDKISGVSYSADRKFISHWTGVKKIGNTSKK